MPAVPSTDVRIRISATAAQANRTFADLDRRLGRPRLHMERLNFQFRRLDRIWTLIAVGSGLAIIKTFVGMAAELQKTQLQLAAFTRDLDTVPKAMDGIIALAERVPFTLGTMTNAFVRLKASGLDPIVDDQGNGPLKDLADAVAAFGGGDEIFKRAGIALQQMAGKGVVSMEELRQQLGEAIPTAMRIWAEQMGLSVAEFIGDVSRGRIEFEGNVDKLFKGFREKFGGAGELLKTTFTGQIQQARLEFEKLSKVVLLDSGSLDFLTSALKLFNNEVDNLGKFLASPEGNSAINNFWQGVENIALFAARATGPLLDLISIISNIVSTIAGVAGALPAEIVGGGILGFILFGRAGIVAGALFGLFSDELAKISAKIASWAGAVIGLADSLGLTDTLTGGLIGFLLFGPKGGLLGLIIGVLDKVVQKVNSWVAGLSADIAASIANFAAQIDAGLESPGDILFNNDKIVAKGKEAGEKARKAFMDKFTGEGTVFGDLETGILAELKNIGSAQGEGASASQKAEEAIKKFFASVKAGVQPIQDAREKIVSMFQAIRDIGGLSPNQLTALGKIGSIMERLRKQAEGGGTQLGRFQASLRIDLAKVDAIIAQVSKRINEMSENDTRIAGLRKELQGLTNIRNDMAQLGDTIIQNMGDRALGGIEPRINRIREGLEQFVTEGREETPLLEQALDRVRSRFAGINKSIVDLIQDVKEKTVADEKQAQTLAKLAALQKRLNEGLVEQEKRTKAIVQAQQEKTALQNEQLIQQAQRAVQAVEMENAFDKTGLAVNRAQDQIDRMVENAEKNIAKIRQQLAKGLITEEDAEAQISRWNTVIERVNAASDQFIERARFNASEWGQMMNSIAQSMEDNLASSIEGLVNGTMTARDALINFYNDITKAVSRYLAKQALVGIFGQGASSGGLGGILSGLITPFGSSGLLGFANGGSMMLGGAGGRDQNVLSLNGEPLARVSRGEQMTIDPVGSSSNGDQFSIQISAVDAQSVRQLFMKEGSALVNALNQRKRLNRA